MRHIYDATIRCSALIVIILVSLWLIRGINFCRVEHLKDGTRVTINFLLDMNKTRFKDSIQIVSQVPYANQFDCKIHWIKDNIVSIDLREKNNIKGQKVYLIIKNADTKIPLISKNCKIPVQFKTKVEMITSEKERLISTETPFVIKFNTPIREKELSKYMKSDADFYITPVKVKNHLNQEVNDTTQFLLTPKYPLENNRKYLLSFIRGLPAESGMVLTENIDITLTTDRKPKIIDVYPKDGQKWVGIYPVITLSTDYPIEKAFLTIDGQRIEGAVKDGYDAEFFLNEPLKANKEYVYKVQVVSKAGELSKEEIIHFSTLPLSEDTVWLEVIIDEKPCIKVYQGEKLIKQIKGVHTECAHTPVPGIYYIQDKNQRFFDAGNVNYLINISGILMIKGYQDEELVKEAAFSKNNEIINYDKFHINMEDIEWIYRNVPDNAMVIIRP